MAEQSALVRRNASAANGGIAETLDTGPEVDLVAGILAHCGLHEASIETPERRRAGAELFASIIAARWHV